MHIALSWTWVVPGPIPPAKPMCLRPPVAAPILTRFVQPACRYCAGHRTVDFQSEPGAAIVSPVDGVVTFVGEVAHSHYITVSTRRTEISATGSPFGLLVTVGGGIIAAPTVTIGETVRAGQEIASATSGPIRLSLRRVVSGGVAEYLDPEPFLARWRGPVRLVPDPGLASVRRRIVQVRWTCARPFG